MIFCNYCTCEDCLTGDASSWSDTYKLKHAQTDKGDWICDTCYAYECCVNAGVQPCEDKNCEHRPKLVSGWSTLND